MDRDLPGEQEGPLAVISLVDPDKQEHQEQAENRRQNVRVAEIETVSGEDAFLPEHEERCPYAADQHQEVQQFRAVSLIFLQLQRRHDAEHRDHDRETAVNLLHLQKAHKVRRPEAYIRGQPA